MQKEISQHPNFKVGYVFSVGQPPGIAERIFNLRDLEISLSLTAEESLKRHYNISAEIKRNITSEADKYDDILLGDYVDTYFNLTWKTVTNLRWLSTFCDKSHHDTFLLIDDDHRVNLSMVMRFFQNTPKSIMRQSIFGLVLTEDHPVRVEYKKCFLSKKEFPMHKFPPFPLGFSQFIGADVVDDMAIASAYTKYDYFPEDVFLD